MESETHFCREAVKVWRGKVIKENYVADRTWSYGKLFILKNDTTIADKDVALTVENLWCFECPVRWT